MSLHGSGVLWDVAVAAWTLGTVKELGKTASPNLSRLKSLGKRH